MADKKPDIKEIMADYDKAVAFFANTPAEAWEQIGASTALKVFKETIDKIPVYKKMLDDKCIDINGIREVADFDKLPVLDKYNYIQNHGFNEVNSVKAGLNLYGLSLSSGTADEPTIWPRYFQYEEFMPLIMDLFMRKYWQVDEKSSLVINAFSMGPWIAGFSLYEGMRPLTQKYNFTQVTTGADLESVIYVINKIAPFYDQVIIYSYPTFARTIMDGLIKAKVDIKKLNLRMFIGGEGHTVEWRRYINKLIRKKGEDDLVSLLDAYGTSDVGLAGMGSALTNLIRELAAKDSKLCQDIFGSTNTVPSLFQYNPGNYYIESVNGDLVFTSANTIPLVRYNIKDRGGVIPFRKMESILKSHGYDYQKLIKAKGLPADIVWQQPFLYCIGRESNTVSMIGATIFPEQIAPCLFNDHITDVHSFKIATTADRSQRIRFQVLIELKEGLKYSKYRQLRQSIKIHDRILEHLTSSCLDFADAYRIDKKVCDPKILIYSYGEGPFAEDIGRTKPRLVVKK